QGEGQTLLNSWFVESFDDFGDKLELRFALPEAMDLGVWHKLSTQDQDVVRKLIKILPDCLQRLQKDGCHISRPWQEWLGMAAEVQRISARHVNAPKAVPSAPADASQPSVSVDEQNSFRASAPDQLLDLLNLP